MGKPIELSKEQKSRFWTKVKIKKPHECWEWTGYCRGEGYGEFGLKSGSYVLAHRVAYTLTSSSIPDNLCVLHQCDNPKCCNPAHLELGDRAKNNRDAFSRNRHKKATGEDSHRSKLTKREVQQIISEYQKGVWGHGTPALASKYGVDAKTIWHIVTGSTWKDITNTEKEKDTC